LRSLLLIQSAVMLAAVVAIVVAILVHKTLDDRRVAVRRRRHDEVAPAVLAWIASEGADDDALWDLIPRSSGPVRERRIEDLAECALDLTRRLKGEVRDASRILLTHLEHPWRVSRRLRHRNPRIRAEAVLDLGEIGGSDLVPFLVAALRDPDPAVRRCAARALRRTGDVSAAAALVTAGAGEGGLSRGILAHSLLGLGPDVVGAMQAGLGHPEPKVRVLACAVLGEARVPAPRHRLAAVCDTDPDPAVRAAAVAALGKIGFPDVVQVVCARTHDDAPEVRHAAITALGAIGDHDTAPELVAAMDDPDPTTARGAAVILASWGETGHTILGQVAAGVSVGALYAQEMLAAP